MVYRVTRKAAKVRSGQAVAAKTRKRIEQGELLSVRPPMAILDPYLEITVRRKATGEEALFECYEGDRIDNYSVYCNGKHQGIQSITTLTQNIRKPIPRFRRMEY